jgi:CubicO group peptidase (beta-lactamase class C family)
MKRRAPIWIAAAAICTLHASAQPSPTAKKPEDAGLSSERLKRIAQVFQSDIDKGEIPGAVLLIARNASISYFQAFGFQDRAQHCP